MVTADDVRTIAMGLPSVEERETWDHPTFRVRGKIFLGLAADGSTVNVKASPDEQAALVATDPETFSPSARVGRYGWVTVRLSQVEPAALVELVTEAWRRTAPKRLLAELDRD